MSLKHKKAKKLLSLFLALVVMLSVAAVSILPAAAEGNEAVKEDANGVFQIRTLVVGTGPWTSDSGKTTNYVKQKFLLYTGSAFLINETTILTCAHVINPDEIKARFLDAGLKLDGVTYEIVLNKDVTIECTLKKYSVQDDYAILTLNERITGKNALVLGDSAKVSPSDRVYALGFPGAVTDIQLEEDTTNVKYDKNDVTITEGNVQKVTNINNTNVIQHGCNTNTGHSGGPLVNEKGQVVGINKWMTVNQNNVSLGFNYSTAIDDVRVVLDQLDIGYPTTDPTDPTPTKSESSQASDSSSSKAESSEDQSSAAQSSIVTNPTVPPTTKAGDNPDGFDLKLIIIIAIAVLVVVIVVVVLIIVLGNKKKSNKPNDPTNGRTVMPPNNQQPPYNRPQPPMGGQVQPPYRPAPPTVPSNEGAGETSVLNDGAGETTVLGNQSAGKTIIRKRNGEKIVINKSEFLIGKERRRVDYCISDNNSISRVHAKITTRAGRCYISDMGSTNCTYVNGSKLSPNQEVILSKGDRIKVSDEEFEFLG